MPSLIKLEAYDAESGHLNVVVETPQGSRNKYECDAKLKVFKISCLLPAGAVFPYDFGFIPSTLGDDGDPLDVLLLMEVPAPGGYLVQARLIGVIEAKQSKGRKTERNDRLIAVSTESHRHKEARSLDDLGDQLLSEIEHFFIAYNEMHGSSSPWAVTARAEPKSWLERGKSDSKKKASNLSGSGNEEMSVWQRTDWERLFAPEVSRAEIVIRGTFVYVSLVYLLRIILKRQAGKVSLSDLLVVTLVAGGLQKPLGARRLIDNGRVAHCRDHPIVELRL